MRVVPTAGGDGATSGLRGGWARCNSGQKSEEEVGRLWGRGVRKVREARNSMETSDVCEGKERERGKDGERAAASGRALQALVSSPGGDIPTLDPSGWCLHQPESPFSPLTYVGYK